MNSSGFLVSGHDFYLLVLTDFSGFLHVDHLNYFGPSVFLCIVYDFYEVALEFYILTF